jgi:hypothetical protein
MTMRGEDDCSSARPMQIVHSTFPSPDKINPGYRPEAKCSTSWPSVLSC